MPKRRAPSPVQSEPSTSSQPAVIAESSSVRQSKRRRVQADDGTSSQSQKKGKSPLQALRKKTLKAKLAATMNIQVGTKGKKKEEPAPPTPDSLAENINLPPNETAADEELVLLRKQLAEKDEQIKVHQQALSTIQQQIQCQICLDTLVRPYSLVPCGHVACLGCLQQWFRAPGPDQNAPPPAQVIVKRKKTCPHCRALVVQRPVAAFLIKEIVAQVEATLNPGGPSTMAVGPDAALEEDPWKDIFPVQLNGAHHTMGGAFIDHEDGGIRRCSTCLNEIVDGMCEACGEVYDFYDASDDSDMEMGFGAIPYLDYLLPPFGDHPNPYDDDDEEDDEENSDDQYESDFVVDDEDLLEEVVAQGEQQFFNPVPQETIEISDDDDEEEPDILPMFHRVHRRSNPIVVSDDDEDDDLSDTDVPPERGLHRGDEDGDGDDEEEERVVDWELQRRIIQDNTYDDADDEEVGDYYEEHVIAHYDAQGDESVAYYSDEY